MNSFLFKDQSRATYLAIFDYLQRLVFLLKRFRKQVVDLVVVDLEVSASDDEDFVLDCLSFAN